MLSTEKHKDLMTKVMKKFNQMQIRMTTNI